MVPAGGPASEPGVVRTKLEHEGPRLRAAHRLRPSLDSLRPECTLELFQSRRCAGGRNRSCDRKWGGNLHHYRNLRSGSQCRRLLHRHRGYGESGAPGHASGCRWQFQALHLGSGSGRHLDGWCFRIHHPRRSRLRQIQRQPLPPGDKAQLCDASGR